MLDRNQPGAETPVLSSDKRVVRHGAEHRPGSAKNLVENHKSTNPQPAAFAALLLFALFSATACGSSSPKQGRIEPSYDKQTGKLTLLKYDSNNNGKFDTWSYMEGARVVRIEIDKDEDGKIDRWEYYDAVQHLLKIGFSRLNDGKVDAWSYSNPDGSTARIDLSTKRDGKADRIEHYEKDALVGAEEDTDGDGQIDKWETYEGARLASVAFDTVHRGTPDRRFLYGADGGARLEVDEKGDGHFVAANEPRAGVSPPRTRK